MNIYVCHATSFDFRNELYTPLRNSSLNDEHTFILPHEENDEQFSSKQLFQSKKCDLVLAEVSFPSTGAGIELGWADVFDIPLLCIYQKGTKYSGALNLLTNTFIAYEDQDDLVKKLSTALREYQ